MVEFIIGFLGAGVGAGIMTIIHMCMKRKWEKEDKQEAKTDTLAEIKAELATLSKKLDSVSNDLAHLKVAEKAILAERIKQIGTKYIEAGEVEFEDRRNLHCLHDAYHNDCGGNGDFDLLMEDVDDLPLKHM